MERLKKRKAPAPSTKAATPHTPAMRIMLDVGDEEDGKEDDGDAATRAIGPLKVDMYRRPSVAIDNLLPKELVSGRMLNDIIVPLAASE